MRILIAEDSALMRRAIVNVVGKLGHEAIEAENGASAIGTLRKQHEKIGLIILDWNMPVMDGYEVLQKVKSDERYANIPVLMATSDGVRDDVIKAIKTGASGYIIKPFQPEELSKRINEILKAPQKKQSEKTI